MLKNKKNNFIIIFLSVFTLVFFGSFLSFKNTNAKIENNVSATANTGGNTISGGGTITTGDAKASVNAQNYVNGGDIGENKIEAKAEVQGDGAKASVSVNGEEKFCTADAGESCEVELENGINGSKGSKGNNGIQEENNGENEIEEKENIVQVVTSAVAEFTKSLTDRIISWFS
jgi:hypothetical protein